MNITIRYDGEERELDVPEGMSIAVAAQNAGMRLLGSCDGHGVCAQCSCRVREGVDRLLKMDGTPHVHPEGYAAFVKTCQVIPAAAGVSINADERARAW